MHATSGRLGAGISRPSTTPESGFWKWTKCLRRVRYFQIFQIGEASSWAKTARIAGLLHLMGKTSKKSQDIKGDVPSSRQKLPDGPLDMRLVAYGSVSLDPMIHTALAVKEAIVRKGWRTFSRRNLFEVVKGRSYINSVDDLREPLRLLKEHRYIRALANRDDEPRRGAPAGPKFEVNPAIRERS